MSQLLMGEGSGVGMMKQSLMNSAMSLSIDAPQSAGFSLTKLMLPVDCWQHLTQQPVS
jgi:hypothetical protein